VIVLGFDTATPVTTVGVLLPGDSAESTHVPAAGERPGHTRELLPRAEEVLEAAGVGWDDVVRRPVGVGPGTFTGLRIGVATARALSQASGAELTAVPSLAALSRKGSDHAGPVLACLDARRGEAFVAGFDAGEQVLGDRAVAPDELGGLVSDGWLAVGDGALKFRDALEAAGCIVPIDEADHRMSALAVCELGRDAPVVAREDLAPNYVREPDATPK